MIKYLLFLVLDIFLYMFAPVEMNRSFMTACFILAVLKFFFILYEGKKGVFDMSKIYFRHSVVFIGCILIVFFQSDLDYIVGIADSTDYFVYNPKVVCAAMAISNMAISAFLIGYKLSKQKENYSTIKRSSHDYKFRKESKSILNMIAVAMLAIFIIFVPREYLDNGYVNNVESGPVVAIMGYIVAVFIAIVVAYYYDIQRKSKQNTWLTDMMIPMAILALFALLVMATGRRTEVVRVGFIALGSYIITKKEKANNRTIAIIAAAGVVVISVLGLYRSIESGTFSQGYAMLKNTVSVFPPTKELSTSVNTLHIAMTHYPSDYPFNLGTSFFPSFLKLIPGLTGAFQLLFNMPLKGSDMIITELYFGTSHISWGLGSSIIADVYISFGAFGVVLVFFFLGRFIRWLEIGTFFKTPSPYFMALSLGCYSQFMFASRGTVGVVFLCWAYACLLIYIFMHPVKAKG